MSELGKAEGEFPALSVSEGNGEHVFSAHKRLDFMHFSATPAATDNSF